MTGKTGGSGIPPAGDFECSVCGRPLAILPDSSPLFFHCENGHFVTLTDLLGSWLPGGQAQTAPTLQLWDERSHALLDIARIALANRHILIAADLLEAGRRIDQRVRDLRASLSTDALPAP